MLVVCCGQDDEQSEKKLSISTFTMLTLCTIAPTRVCTHVCLVLFNLCPVSTGRCFFVMTSLSCSFWCRLNVQGQALFLLFLCAQFRRVASSVGFPDVIELSVVRDWVR
jgi:hypothetical protein